MSRPALPFFSGGGVFGWCYKCKGWETDPNAYVYIVLQREDKAFEAAAKALGKPEWINDPKFSTADARDKNKEEIYREIEQFTIGKDKFEAVAELSKAGVPCVRGRAVQGAEDLGGEDALFAREGGLSGVLEAVETARGRLARLVEATRSAAAAALLMNAVCTVSSIAGGAAWPFVPVAAAIYACIYLYYARQTR